MRLLSLAVAGFLATAEAVWPSTVKLAGLNYDMQICKSAADEFADLQAIAGISHSVRIYGLSLKNECPVTRLLATSKNLGLKVAMGMWLDNVTNFDTQLHALDAVLKTGKVDSNVVGFHVGSEAIYRKDHTAAKAIDYLDRTRNLFQTHNINMKLTIADVVDSYYWNPSLLDAVDYVSINQFSFWERVDPAKGMQKMLDRIRSIRAQAAAQGKEVIISETGWPSDGESKGGGVPSIANQRTFFQDFYHQMTAHGIPYFWFVAYDALWFTWAESTVEMHFGVMNPYSRQIKPSYQNMDFTARTTTTLQSARGLLAEYMKKDDLEHVEGVEITTESANKLDQFRYKWFWNAAKQQFRSVNSDRCLDVFEDKGGYNVHTYTCYDGNANQQWRYDVKTQLMEHANYKGYCLEDATTVRLSKCDASNANQRWGIGSAPGRTCSTIEDGLDFIGNDVGSQTSKDAEGCCVYCAAVKGCNAFTWTNHAGGTCWLKSGRGSTTFTAGARSAVISTITPSPNAPTPTTPTSTTPAPTTPAPTTPTPSMCSIENNIDYVGNDVGNARSSNAEGCCSLCLSTSGCKAFSWNDYQGGTCWFKSSKGAFVSKPGTRSAVMSSTPACSKIEEGIDYTGADVANAAADTADKCCSICRESKKGCKAYTWTNYNGGTCWLKSGKGSAIAKAGAHSAVVL